jgi:hypothetical protein
MYQTSFLLSTTLLRDPMHLLRSLKGRDGTIVVDRSNSLAWAHPFLLDAVVNYGKDLYLNGHLQEARQWFQIYMQCLEKDAESVPELLPAVAIRKVEIASLLQRFSANLDYFSNPAGWTPMLSFEISLTAFRRQVDTAIPIMFTKYWLSRRSDDITAKAQALTEATDQLTALVKKDRDTLAGLQQNLVTLHDEARAISQEMKDIQDDLKKKEQELERRAQANVEERNRLPFWKQGLRTMGAVCSVMPVYQPVLGSIGTGLSILSNIDTAQPLDTIKGLVTVSDGFTDDALKKSCEDLNDITSQFDLRLPVLLLLLSAILNLCC